MLSPARDQNAVSGCRSLSDFRLQRKVGEGRNSSVYQALHCPSNSVVALKVYAKCMLTAMTRRQVQREIEIQGRLNHEHIAQLVRPPIEHRIMPKQHDPIENNQLQFDPHAARKLP